MNLAEAINRGLIAEAIPDRRQSTAAPRDAGVPNVRVHEAQLEKAPFDYSADAQRARKSRRRR